MLVFDLIMSFTGNQLLHTIDIIASNVNTAISELHQLFVKRCKGGTFCRYLRYQDLFQKNCWKVRVMIYLCNILNIKV